MARPALLLFASLLYSLCPASSTSDFITKCCPKGEQLQTLTSSRKCVTSTNNSHLVSALEQEDYLVRYIPDLSGLCEISDVSEFSVKHVNVDGSVPWRNGDSVIIRSYDCVDSETNENTGESQILALSCNGHSACPSGFSCVEKCCRAGHVLESRGPEANPECVPSDRTLWREDDYEFERVGELIVKSTVFYERLDLMLCYNKSGGYEIVPDGSLRVSENLTSRTYCIDKMINTKDGEVLDVLLTTEENCHDRRPQITESESGISLYTASAALSLFCLLVVFLVYWFVPSFNNLAGRIVLINVVFTALFCGFLLVFYSVGPSSFYLQCANLHNPVCLFLRNYSCASIGYLGYLVTMATFSWMTIMGLDLFWKVYNIQGRDPDQAGTEKYGFNIQISFGPGLPLTLLLALVLLHQLEADHLATTTIVPLATLISCSCWLLLLLLQLLWTTTRQDAPPSSSDNSKLRLFSTIGLGLPLFLTGLLALLHLLLPQDSRLNPLVGETRCFLGASRTLPLLHTPILVLVALNTLVLPLLVWQVFSIKRNATSRQGQGGCSVELKGLLLLYGKLFLILGVTWLFEPLSEILSSQGLCGNICDRVVNVANTLNLLRGVTMFIIFICNRSSLKRTWRFLRLGSQAQAQGGRSLVYTKARLESSTTSGGGGKGARFVRKNTESSQF